MIIPQFETAAELRAHYASVFARTQHYRNPKPPVILPTQIVIAPPPKPVQKTLAHSQPKLATIIGAVAKISGVPVDKITTDCRVKKVVYVRQVYFWIARKYTGHGLQRIADQCGLLDHTSVLYGIKQIDIFPDRYEAILQGALVELGLK